VVDLIAGRLDEHHVIRPAMSLENCPQHIGVSRTPGWYAGTLTGPVAPNDVPQPIKCAHERTAKKVSISASVLLPSIGPIFPTDRAPAALAR